MIFIAGSATKPSLDLPKHGIFATAALDGLKGKADAEGYRSRRQYSRSPNSPSACCKAIGDLARDSGTTKEQKEQKGSVLEAQQHDFVVAYNPKEHAKAANRMTKFTALAKEKSLDPKLAEEGHNLLIKMPKLEARYNRLPKAISRLRRWQTRSRRISGRTQDRAGEHETERTGRGPLPLTVMKAVDLVRKSYVKETTKGPLVEYAINGLYKGIDEKVPTHLEDRLDKAKEMETPELLRLLTDSRQTLGKREDLAKGQDITFSLNPMLSKLDKHTGYIPPEVVQQFRTGTSGRFSGIGVQNSQKTTPRDETAESSRRSMAARP